MKAIKALVVFLGILLMAGLGLMGYGLFAKKAQYKGMAAPAPAASAPASADFGTVAIPVPAGSRIEQVTAAGERVVLRLSGAGPDRLLVLDPAQGRVVGGFVLAPEPQVR
ncbi:hypothetical protein A6A04_18160 [Paramagnetospirillum marisnigri]|uniref:Uncharacterized protein n=1 Tax=Paramagnetospirillum marisnigri TaxID=1285242 RepID=A0A178MQY9_9PROT|nr:hypothetical protein [Paramagnetospirillum marisnigri]OAN50518.1 hypothetical protein A6A04_18160 [Paramagnetospirillum marisnigri]